MTQDHRIPDWVNFPDEQWQTITPGEAGLDERRFREFLDAHPMSPGQLQGETHRESQWGCVLTRGGYVLHTWGDASYRCQTASVGKAFTRAVLGLAADAGLVDPDEPIRKTWTGEGQLSHPHKHLDVGHHTSLTWRHLIGPRDEYAHYGGFPVTAGNTWRTGKPRSNELVADPIPPWAKYTADPFYDNYAHTEPGTMGWYSSGGVWRLSQALTVLWGRDIKQVLDERLFRHLGIPADRWDWTPGRVIHENRDGYPAAPGYGDFLDPPYEIEGHIVRGGPGWVVMSSEDLARFGLLVATDGVWKGRQLISREWVRSHHGGNDSFVGGESAHYTAIGKVAARGMPYPLGEKLFLGPIRRS